MKTRPTPTRFVSINALFGIVPEKALNNGQPSFATMLIAIGRPAAGAPCTWAPGSATARP